MKIAVIGGTGKEGRGLAARWALAGQHVILGSRQLEKARRVAAELADRLGTRIEGLANRDAAAAGDVVVLSVPYAAQRDILADIADACRGKVLVNVGVPLDADDPTRIKVPPAGSAAAEAQAFLGDGVKVVAAFQNISSAKLKDPRAPVDSDVLVCGDDAEAKQVAIRLAELAGMRALDAGPLVNAVGVETLTAIIIGINIRYKAKGAGIRVTGLNTGGD